VTEAMIALNENVLDDPARAYVKYAAAIQHRDVEAVLEKLSEDYGRHLRAAHEMGRFPALFELWCETFPRLVGVVACFVDGDCATVEMLLQSDGRVETGYATLVRHAADWFVDFERRASGLARIPSGRVVSGSIRSLAARDFETAVPASRTYSSLSADRIAQ
jgi:hypothetical protein